MSAPSLAPRPISRPIEFPFHLPDELATQALGAAIASVIAPGFVMYLHGELGAGKTTLTRGALRGLGVTGALRSPSYALVEPYELAALGGGSLHHFDFYRLERTPLAWRDVGFEEAFEPPHAAIVEWPQYAQGLPVPALTVRLLHKAASRQVICTVHASAFSAPLHAALQGFTA